jgi:hypothetical protein
MLLVVSFPLAVSLLARSAGSPTGGHFPARSFLHIYAGMIPTTKKQADWTIIGTWLFYNAQLCTTVLCSGREHGRHSYSRIHVHICA